MEYILHLLQHRLFPRLKAPDLSENARSASGKLFFFLEAIFSLGITHELDDYEKRKLRIFNQLNFFQFLTGTIVPFSELFLNSGFPFSAWLIASLPALISVLVLYLNAKLRYQAALLCYFILYPLFTGFVYMNGMDTGVELSFILYGILSVFFLQELGYMLYSVCLSMMSYFILFVIWKKYPYQLEPVTTLVYLVNQVLAIIYIFYALYLIKRENLDHQLKITLNNEELQRKNAEIEEQRKIISQKAELLEKQAAGLKESDGIKNKLFSIISHDLRAPMVALRNLFQNANDQNLSTQEIKTMMPDILNDLNYSTSLIENLLQWAKCQMQSDVIRPQKLDLGKMVYEVTQLLHLQSSAKQIRVEQKTSLPVYAYADYDMISLVLRNLLSNAIKFTPEGGTIVIGTNESPLCAEVYVRDSGIGISRNEMKKINANSFYTTNGTRNENGTGLGLMLCRDFLIKNDGRLMIESEPGKGSTFSFTLPLA